MNPKANLHNLSRYVNLFSEENHGRPTRLGVFEPLNCFVNDYWLEDGLPLGAISIDARNDTPMVLITLDGFTHTVPDAKRFDIHFSIDGLGDGIDVVDSEGRTSILRFEA